MKYSDEQKFLSIVKGVQEKFPKLQGEFFSILSPTTTLKFIDEVKQLGLTDEYNELKSMYDVQLQDIEQFHITVVNSFMSMSLFWCSKIHLFLMTDVIDNFINDVLYYKRLDKKLGLKIDFSEYNLDNFEQVIQINKFENMTTKEVDEFIKSRGYDIELVRKWELDGTENFGKIIHSNDFYDKMILSDVIGILSKINHEFISEQIHNPFVWKYKDGKRW